MKKLTNMKLDFKYIFYLMVALPSLGSIAHGNSLPPNLEEYFQTISTSNPTNSTRGKRQLFREDIPHHRPLSGNVYANQHGFPHPGRWTDGLRSEHKPRPHVYPSHQQYIDMIDNNQYGHYHNRPKVPHPHSVSFGSDVHHGGGGGGFGPPYKPLFDHDGPGSNFVHGYPGPSHSEVGVDYDGPGPDYGPGPSKAPFYGPPQHQGNGGPKTVVHYHPIQYGNVLNFPESNPNTNHNPSSGYGPPNHSSGEPIGPPSIQSGFLPSKGFFNGGDNGHHPNYNGVHHSNNHKDSYFQHDHFKIFPHSTKPVNHDVPIPIPILAQFHSAKPLKFTKIKNPIHIFYEHTPRRRPGRPGPHQFQHHQPNRPYKSNWLLQYGL